ncbi:tetratricopeptide repeat protein [Pseudooceanicola sp. C21-150M6]|uniref:tetratricopeptide repeat protein n=1 Tax=Pseudooceanicola sp. C21-150M6 TaxID=3434355 RepID=UPI003D7F91BD
MRQTLTATALTLILPLAALPAFAAGDSSTPPKPTETTTKCADGEVFDKDKGACVKSASLGLDDDQRYEAVRELAYAGRPESALKVIEGAEAKDSPRFLTYVGFSLRQMGDVDGAMQAYRKALAIDPDYILARSYMAQGLLTQGHREAAVAQLREIEARNGYGTWAHKSLMMAMKGEFTAY